MQHRRGQYKKSPPLDGQGVSNIPSPLRGRARVGGENVASRIGVVSRVTPPSQPSPC